MPKYIILFALSGCSASLLPVVDCDSNVQCRDAFGYGSVCGDAGLCETVTMLDRCDSSFPEDLTLPISQDETFLMATMFDRSDGDVARYLAGELAVRQANEELSSGADIQFAVIHCNHLPDNPDDDGSETAQNVVDISTFLAEDLGISVILGPPSSGLTTVVYNTVAEQNNTLIISPSATSTGLIDIDGLTTTDASPGLLWRTAAPDSGQGLAIFADMTTRFDDDPSDGQDEFRTRSTQNLAIIHQTGSYGESLNDIVAGLFLADGRTVSSFPFQTPTDINLVVAELSAQSFDEVLFISSETIDYATFLSAAATNSYYDDMPIFLTDGGFSADLFDAGTTGLYPNVRGTAPATPQGTVYNSFESLYNFRYDSSPAAYGFTANTWDAAWLAIYGYYWALHNEDGVNGVSIARGLRHVSSGPSVDVIPIRLPGVISAFEGGDSVNLVGASGPLDFDATTGEISAITLVWTIQGNGAGFQDEYEF